MLEEGRVKIREIADIIDISAEGIQNILHEKLGMRKLSARWMPRLLTVEQKRNSMTTSEHCLDMFKRNPKEYLRRFVTVDETWIHRYTPVMKELDFTRGTCSKEGENASIGRKSHGHRFLGIARHHLHRLFGEGKHNHGAVLC